jgi:hypothetical protein
MNNGIQETSGYYGEHEEHETTPLPEEEEPEHIDPENQCIECGKEALSMCGCCGAPLCHMHQETQAGFCSSFRTYSFNEGQEIEVTDGFVEEDLVQDKIRFQEDAEISGCWFESSDPKITDMFFPMEDLPEGKDKPVSPLSQVDFQVVEE